jgi:flagellar hook assembly protein FlgD
LITDVAPPDNQPLPLSAVLYPNYPNPFNPSTVIPFRVTGGTSEQFVTLDIFNIHGQLVARIFDGRLPPGNFTIVWNGRNAGGAAVASGTYICRLRAAGQVHSRTMVLVR